jgi:hypothetical protein
MSTFTDNFAVAATPVLMDYFADSVTYVGAANSYTVDVVLGNRTEQNEQDDDREIQKPSRMIDVKLADIGDTVTVESDTVTIGSDVYLVMAIVKEAAGIVTLRAERIKTTDNRIPNRERRR